MDDEKIGKMVWQAVNDAKKACIHASAVLCISAGKSFTDTHTLMQYMEGKVSDEDLLAMFREIRSQGEGENGDGFDRIFGLAAGVIMFHAKMICDSVEKEFGIEPPEEKEQHPKIVEIIRTELDIGKLTDPSQMVEHLNEIMKKAGAVPIPPQILQKMFGDLGAAKEEVLGFTVYGTEDEKGFDTKEFGGDEDERDSQKTD